MVGILALGDAACMSRQGPQPPTFPDGGLLARSTPPPNPWSLQRALDGVYDTSNRFGANVVVHASQWGGVNPGAGMEASVSILALDHAGFAVMQAGCFLDTTGATPLTRLVLEGYWRYLDDPRSRSRRRPVSSGSSSRPGGRRLRVQRAGLVPRPAGDPRPAPTPRAFVGATGNSVDVPGSPLTVSWLRARKSRVNAEGRTTFFVGARQGDAAATTAVSGNTAEGVVLAAQLGTDYLIDIRLTKDQVPVLLHQGLFPGSWLPGLTAPAGSEDYTYAELLANCRAAERRGTFLGSPTCWSSSTRGRACPPGSTARARTSSSRSSAILGDLQKRLVSCNPPPPEGLREGQRCLFPGSAPIWERGIIALPSADFVTEYRQALAAGRLQPNQHCLAEEDPSAVTGIPCVAWKPRYTLGPMTSEMQSLQQQGFFTGYWTINDPGTMDAFLTAAIPNGILTNRLGLLNQRFEMVGTTPPYTPYRLSTP